MANLAYTDITATVVSTRRPGPRIKETVVKLVFGDSALLYPSGGIDVSSLAFAKMCGHLSPLRYLEPIQNKNLTSNSEWEYDPATSKLRGFQYGHIPPIVINEAVTLSSDAGTLKYLPAHIIQAVGTISATVTPLKLVPHTVTLATTELGINWTTGAVTTKASDSVSALKVSYIPQQPHGFFSQANMAINEAITLDTDKVNTASRAATMAYCYQTAATAARRPMGHAVASGVVLLDINDSGNTSFDCHADEDGKAAVVTYLKYSGLANNAGVVFVDQAEITLTSEVKEWGKTAGDRVGGLMIPGICGQMNTEQDAAFSLMYVGNEDVTPANAAASFNIATQVLTTAQTGDAEKVHDTPFLFLSPMALAQMSGFRQEFTTNDAPSSTTLYFRAVS